MIYEVQGSISSTFYWQLLRQQVNAELICVQPGAHSIEVERILVWHNGEVGCNFVGETDWRLLAPKNDYQLICTLHHKVGEIDPSQIVDCKMVNFIFILLLDAKSILIAYATCLSFVGWLQSYLVPRFVSKASPITVLIVILPQWLDMELYNRIRYPAGV